MTDILNIKENRIMIRCAVFLFALVIVLASVAYSAGEQSGVSLLSPNPVFQPGESLSYSISWSNIITAGTAVMEVDREMLPEGKDVLVFTATGYSKGIVEMIYHVQDSARSVFDPVIRQSLSYNLKEAYGKKKRLHDLKFNADSRTVISKLNDDAPETYAVPDHVLDTLSALYNIRMLDDLTIGKITTINVFENDKNWSVDVQALAREKVKTPAGEFDTIKLRTYPRYEGVFLNKGVAFLWLTDDFRKIPVLMKSSLKVGSFVFTLTDIRQRGDVH
jgi:uncharacterized protein DUF3108